jgi:hypothetical protein
MSKTTRKLAGHIEATQLQSLAAEGVQRALALRAEQVQEVSGGLTAMALASFDDLEWCGTVIKKFPIPRPGTIFTGGVPVIINGRYGDLNAIQNVAVAGY